MRLGRNGKGGSSQEGIFWRGEKGRDGRVCGAAGCSETSPCSALACTGIAVWPSRTLLSRHASLGFPSTVYRQTKLSGTACALPAGVPARQPAHNVPPPFPPSCCRRPRPITKPNQLYTKGR